jgi:hypothetical protein
MKFTLPLLICLLAAKSTLSAQQSFPVQPYEPEELLLALPTTPTDWTLLRSEADMSLGQWLLTKATRVFQAPPSPTSTDGTKPPPGEVEISVADTGGYAPALAGFADFKPQKVGAFEKRLLGSLPAIVVTDEEGRQFAQILVSSRYLVEITFTRLPTEKIETWLRTFHFDLLPARNAPPSTTPPREYQLSHLDELHPAKSRSYRVSTTDPKRLPEPPKAEGATQSPP